jgi:FkbM family methyltransferase
MKKIFSTAFFLYITSLFSTYGERCYEGINSNWTNHESVESRLEIVKKFISSNPTIFEVGAFDGNDSLKLARMWPKGSIISFEANPVRYAQYQEKAQNFNNMAGYNLAVNTYNGHAEFFLCWGTHGKDSIFEGASSLLPASKSMEIHYMGPKIQVPCVVLDDWCKENQVEKLEFMWLDLEGFEIQFLKSSPEILKTTKVIYTETNFYQFREGTTQYFELKTYLESIGFELIAHWYNEGLQGDAIFVRNEILKTISN